MSVERIHRLLRLITMLQSGRAGSVADLVNELSVSRRTLFRDLKMLQAAGIPCYHQSGAGYRIVRSFFLPPINLTVTETLGLMLLAKTAAAQHGRPLFGPALSAISKLSATVPEPIRQACNEMMANVSIDLGAQAISDREAKHYTTLQRCIDEGRSCGVKYSSPAESGPASFQLDPYALHFAARAWYVLGRTDVHKEVRVLKLSRLIELEPQQRLFRKPTRFRVADKLGKAWQLIPEGKVHQIEIEFSPKVATNVSEVRWHRSQNQKMLPDGRCRMTFEVDGLEEIQWWICSYADQAEVLRPAELRERVARLLRGAAARYGGAAEEVPSSKFQVHR